MIWSTPRSGIDAVRSTAHCYRTKEFHGQHNALDVEPTDYFKLDKSSPVVKLGQNVMALVQLNDTGKSTSPNCLVGVRSRAAHSDLYSGQVRRIILESHAIAERLAFRDIVTPGTRLATELRVARSFDTLDQGRIAYTPERLEHLKGRFYDAEAYADMSRGVSSNQRELILSNLSTAYAGLFQYLRPAQQTDIDVDSAIMSHALAANT